MKKRRDFLKWAGEWLLALGLLPSPLGSFLRNASADREEKAIPRDIEWTTGIGPTGLPGGPMEQTGPTGSIENFTRSTNQGIFTRTLQSKLAETVSVKDFGAYCDGVHDDTVATQTAIDYLSNNGGGTLYYPSGCSNSLISSTIYIHSSNIRIEGNNAIFIITNFEGILFQIGTPGSPNTQAIDVFDIEMKNVQILPSSNNTSVNFDNITGLFLDNCNFRGCAVNLKYIWGPSVIRSCDVQVRSMTVNLCTALLIENCVFEPCTESYALTLDGTGFSCEITVNECHFEEVNGNIYVTGGCMVSITNNSIGRIQVAGPSQITIENASGNVFITQNTFQLTSGYAINVLPASSGKILDVLISDNWFATNQEVGWLAPINSTCSGAVVTTSNLYTQMLLHSINSVTNGGSGYTTGSVLNIPTDDGTYWGVRVTVKTVNNGAVIDVDITDTTRNWGYKTAGDYNTALVSGTGSGCVLNISLVGLVTPGSLTKTFTSAYW